MKPLRIIFALLAFTITTTAAAFAAAELLETGSSLVYPLMNLWVPVYTKAHGDVKITTQSTGSGTGISQAVAGVAQIGASDAYMSDAQLGTTHMLNIPLAISAQQVNYNHSRSQRCPSESVGPGSRRHLRRLDSLLGRRKDQRPQRLRAAASCRTKRSSRSIAPTVRATRSSSRSILRSRRRAGRADRVTVRRSAGRRFRTRLARTAIPVWCKPAKAPSTRSRTSA